MLHFKYYDYVKSFVESKLCFGHPCVSVAILAGAVEVLGIGPSAVMPSPYLFSYFSSSGARSELELAILFPQSPPSA